MRLSKNFWLSEFTRSQYASRNNIDNTPTSEHINNLRLLCVNVLQPTRDEFGSMQVNSGYRCVELNAAIGGASTSQHTKGEAADVEKAGVDNLEMAMWIRDNCEFDQLILEYYEEGKPDSGWIHVSFRQGGCRNQVLTKIRGEKGYRHGFPEKEEKNDPTP